MGDMELCALACLNKMGAVRRDLLPNALLKMKYGLYGRGEQCEIAGRGAIASVHYSADVFPRQRFGQYPVGIAGIQPMRIEDECRNGRGKRRKGSKIIHQALGGRRVEAGRADDERVVWIEREMAALLDGENIGNKQVLESGDHPFGDLSGCAHAGKIENENFIHAMSISHMPLLRDLTNAYWNAIMFLFRKRAKNRRI